VKVFKPNFTSVELDDKTVTVNGVSDEDVVDKIVDIRVILVQQSSQAGGSAQFTSGGADKITSTWHASLPSEGFVKGPAVAFGTETRSENFTTVTWAQELPIE
jgi:hypothetical protein